MIILLKPLAGCARITFKVINKEEYENTGKGINISRAYLLLLSISLYMQK
ncbi:hypothetical protein [Clostridium sporogenes]|nr:hypothetical protein [Clostridium sporogenes]EDU36666.1 hypothetical protein CLOSPO_02834 [Clostridium sporogenes ATCC 15579]